MQTRRIIRADGTEESLPRPVSTKDIARMIGAGPKGLDIVNLLQFGFPLWVMCVDGSGHETKMVDHGGGHFELVSIGHTKPVNEKATAIYRMKAPHSAHVIVGDVAIIPDDDYAES